MAELTRFFCCSGDFKTNEKKILDELDDLVKKQSKKPAKRGGDLKDAMSGTEQIREWVSPLDIRACAGCSLLVKSAPATPNL